MRNILHGVPVYSAGEAPVATVFNQKLNCTLKSLLKSMVKNSAMSRAIPKRSLTTNSTFFLESINSYNKNCVIDLKSVQNLKFNRYRKTKMLYVEIENFANLPTTPEAKTYRPQQLSEAQPELAEGDWCPGAPWPGGRRRHS